MIKKAILMFLAMTSCAFADHHQEDQVNEFVTKIASDVVALVKSKQTDDITEKELTNIFQNVMDIDWMAKFAIGKKWLQLNADEKSTYLSNYKNYLTTLYVPTFKKYNGQKLNIKDVKPLGNGYYIVTTTIYAEGTSAPFKVEYRVKDMEGAYKVRDIVAEGISLINTCLLYTSPSPRD